MTSDKRIVIDTNIWIYFINGDSPFHEKARRRLGELREQGRKFVVTNQIIREVLVVLTHPDLVEHPLNPPQAIELVDKLFSKAASR